MVNMDNSQYLEKNLEMLVNNGKIGLHKFQHADIQTKPNHYLELTKGYKNYHFCVNIPYAGKILNWDIIFDPKDFAELPDFDFNDYSFLPEPDINYIAEYVPSWDGWDLTNPQSLLNILNEFLALYKRAQIEKLYKQNKYSNLKEQFEDLLSALNLSEDNVEVYIENKNLDVQEDENVCVNFSVLLPIDFSTLPEYYQEDSDELLNPGEDFAYLNFQIKKLENPQIKVVLNLSPRADQVLSKIKLPKLRKDATLADYALAVQHTIEEQIKVIIEQHRRRNLFVSALVDAFSSGIVEYDASRFYKVSFIYEDFEDYDCLVTITLGAKFPQERPKAQLSSLYCQVGRNCNSSLVFPFDADAPLDRTVRLLRDALHSEIKGFQNHKH